MSRPLHYYKRFIIAFIFIILFLLLIPVVILYSTGYRLDKDFSLTPTGGLYVFYPESGAQVYLNGELSDQTSLFERGIFIDELDPENFSVEVRKAGYIPWKKTIEVKGRRVAEAYPYLIPEVMATSSVKRFISLASGTTVTNSLYNEVTELFATSTASSTPALLKRLSDSTTTPIIASSTTIMRKDIEIAIEGTSTAKKIIASWKGGRDSMPFYFCDAERLVCNTTLVVTSGDIKHVDFYPGRNDVVLYSTTDGIYVTELDTRPEQNTHQLLAGNLDFKEDDQRIFVKERATYYELIFTASSTLINATSI
jgi:hypothetical protein